MTDTKQTVERDCGYTTQGATLHLVGQPAVSGLPAMARCGRVLRETLRAVWQGRGAPMTCAWCVKGDTGVDPSQRIARIRMRDAAQDLYDILNGIVTLNGKRLDSDLVIAANQALAKARGAK